MTNLFEKINHILAEWDPIGVGTFIASDEYRSYVPRIIANLHDEAALKKYLEHLLTDTMGLEHNPENTAHIAELENTCKLLMQAKENE